MEKDNKHYGNVDILKYVFAIIIIVVHLRPFFNQYQSIDLLFNNIIGRICVPFYFFVSGFFVGRKGQGYINSYIKSLIPVYLIWSIFYLPFGIKAAMDYFPDIMLYIQSMELSMLFKVGIGILMAPVLFVVALLYSGTYYHLWYFPALLISLLIIKIYLKHFSIQSLLWISFILIILGSSETYFGALPIGVQDVLSYYFKYFITTRNFLFFGLFYVSLGYSVGEKGIKDIKHKVVKLVACIILLLVEFVFLQTIKRLNSNIVLASIPLTYYLFINIVYYKNIINSKKVLNYIRQLSKYYYLLHPLFIVLYINVTSLISLDFNGFVSCFIVILFTHIGSMFLIYANKKLNLSVNKRRCLYGKKEKKES